MQRGVGGVADVEAGLCVPLVCVLAAKVLDATLVLTTESVLSGSCGSWTGSYYLVLAAHGQAG